jgi:K+-transporting ATPase ATPase C chain
MWTELKRGVLFTAVTVLLFGGVYHLLVWGVSLALFPNQAEGSLIRRSDGSIVGSRLIAQKFTRPEYFHPRPSAVDYDASSTGGGNLGPTNPEHLKAVRQRLQELIGSERPTSPVPSEMVTTSGGGLDPHISPGAADLQAPRVALARGVSVERVQDLIRSHTEPPTLGFLGRARINVLELNLALDEALPAAASGRP